MVHPSLSELDSCLAQSGNFQTKAVSRVYGLKRDQGAGQDGVTCRVANPVAPQRVGKPGNCRKWRAQRRGTCPRTDDLTILPNNDAAHLEIEVLRTRRAIPDYKQPTRSIVRYSVLNANLPIGDSRVDNLEAGMNGGSCINDRRFIDTWALEMFPEPKCDFRFRPRLEARKGV